MNRSRTWALGICCPNVCGTGMVAVFMRRRISAGDELKEAGWTAWDEEGAGSVWAVCISSGKGFPGRMCFVCSLTTVAPDLGWKRAMRLISLR